MLRGLELGVSASTEKWSEAGKAEKYPGGTPNTLDKFDLSVAAQTNKCSFLSYSAGCNI